MTKTKLKNPKTLEEAFEIINQELLETFIKKHKDYGKGNILSIKELGIAFRISEKAERLKNLLMTKQKPKSEPLKDTLIDISVYGVIAEMYRRGWFQTLEAEK